MSELQEFVKKRTASYPGISSRKLYGLEAFYLKNSPFIVITKDDQIVVKVDDFEVKAQLLNMPEVTKWSLDGKDMENWLLLPTSFN
ncbi:MAG: TfoX/Sxy family transcriptional regulator of competence genes, partial [Bacteriovoracaceae bacterium]